jgi:hypothetical protein
MRMGGPYLFYGKAAEKIRRPFKPCVRFSPTRIPGFLGGDSLSSSSAFDGWMHHLRVWNRALTPLLIRVVAYNSVSSGSAELLAEYTMQGTGQVLRDSTGRHDGTIGSTSMVEPARWNQHGGTSMVEPAWWNQHGGTKRRVT